MIDSIAAAEVKSLDKARKNLVHGWCILLKKKVDSVNCCEHYMEKHLDVLVVCYHTIIVFLYLHFDVASDAFSTFKDLMTKHPTAVSEYLMTTHYTMSSLSFHHMKVMMTLLKVFVANLET
ncbi:calcium-binding protein 39-like isoform X2 [Salvia divinorum]|uniref:Calcium-binding protein 39-like isoform X2 n=1 Tax=Salvia divinorum TaxID=28513 RepID=A0ABD1GWL5_SALDI